MIFVFILYRPGLRMIFVFILYRPGLRMKNVFNLMRYFFIEKTFIMKIKTN